MFDVKAALCVGRGDVTAPCSTRADIHLTVCVSPFCLICNLTCGYSSISPRMALTDSTVVPIKVKMSWWTIDRMSVCLLLPDSLESQNPCLGLCGIILLELTCYLLSEETDRLWTVLYGRQDQWGAGILAATLKPDDRISILLFAWCTS